MSAKCKQTDKSSDVPKVTVNASAVYDRENGHEKKAVSSQPVHSQEAAIPGVSDGERVAVREALMGWRCL
jgi:hypothetical protein